MPSYLRRARRFASFLRKSGIYYTYFDTNTILIHLIFFISTIGFLINDII